MIVTSPIKNRNKAASTRGYRESVSPITIGFVSLALALVVTVIAMDEVDLAIEEVSGIRVLGNNKEQGSASELVGIRNIPLYGDKNLQGRLSSEISESIFVVEPEAKPHSDKKVETVKSKIKPFNWERPTKTTLLLHGISSMNKAAYINSRRYVVGDVLKEFPIKGDLQSKLASLIAVKDNHVIVAVGGKHIQLSLKE